MDIRKMNRKRFALNAIASAVLALNAEMVYAAPCPANIVGTALAGVICEFTGTSIVRVVNGGEVGGITMFSFSPPAGKLLVDAGGLIANSTSTGINILSSTLSNGLLNNGTISASSMDITVSNSNIGDIINNGSLVSNSSSAIRIMNSSTVNGGITNNGTITSNGINNIGVVLGGNSVMNGDITNTGSINIAGSGSAILIFFTSILNGNISNSGTINAGNKGIDVLNNTIINGNISNSGSIVAGTDGIRISNASTVNGVLSNSGLINAGDIGISVRSATTVGSISNSGTINGGNVGIAVASTSAVVGGISNSGVIQGGINAISVDVASTVNNINILGQNARLIGAVDALNSDVNITAGAIFTSEGTFNVNNVNVASNAVFHMANDITAQTAVTNAGTLDVGSALQNIFSTSGYVQSTGGILQVGLTNTASYGQLLVNNTVDLSQSGNLNVQLTQNASIHAGDVFSNIISGNTLITPLSGFNVSSNSFVWKFTANANTTAGVDLTAAINPAAYNACQGEYCQGVANVILGQIAIGNPLFNPYGVIATNSAFQVAAGQATPMITNENTQVTQLITKAVMDVVPMWGALHGKSTGDAMLYPPDKSWIKPYGATIIQDEMNSVPGFHASTYGVVIGKDVSLAEDWLIGGALALGSDNVRGKGAASTQSVNGNVYQGIVYEAKKLPHHFYFAGQGLIGYEDNNTNRSIPLYASTAKGSFNSWFTNLRAQLGWNLYAPNQDLVLTPELDASYLFINQGGYRESGSVMNLAVKSSNNSFLELGVYGHGAYHLIAPNSQDVILSAYVGIARDVLNTQPNTSAALIAGGPNFSTFGVQPNAVIRSGVGVTVANENKPLKLDVNYDMQTGNNAYSGVGSVTMTYKI